MISGVFICFLILENLTTQSIMVENNAKTMLPENHIRGNNFVCIHHINNESISVPLFLYQKVLYFPLTLEYLNTLHAW